MEEVERKLVSLPSLDKQASRLKHLLLGHATDLEMDNQGRVLLPRELRDFAGLERQAMLIGQGNKFELWDEQRWAERREMWLAAEDDGEKLHEKLENLSY